MKPWIFILVALSIPSVQAAAQSSLADSLLPTETPVRFQLQGDTLHTWVEGVAMRFASTDDHWCVGAFSEALGGFTHLDRLDSLEVRIHSLIGSGNAVRRGPLIWRALPLRALVAELRPSCRSQ